MSVWMKTCLVLALTLCFVPSVDAGKELFPEYDCIRPNVAFWKKVYSEYPSTKGLIHDVHDLRIIYEVIDLVEADAPGARKINKKRVKKVKAKYNTILQKLASGKKTGSAEEKRVAALFGPHSGKAAFRAAHNNIRLQRCQQNRFREGLIRSGAYLAEIKRIFKSYGLPEDLAYLPHVESSFNYKAYSKFGAAGIWQFTRSTGKRYMTVDYTLDERRDPIRATYAAARYLKNNYGLLGDWPTAITSYNHGESGMLRAKKKFGSYDNIFKKYKGGYFKFASRNFYSEFLAAREIAKDHVGYFGSLKLEKPVASREVKLRGYTPIQSLADYFQVDMKRLRAMNPAIRQPVYNGQKYVPKGYSLRLPMQKGRDMNLLAAAMPADMFKLNQKRSRFYRVQRGDTAGLVARRNRVKLSNLILANQLDRRATIYVGQNLRIPALGEAVTLASVAKTKKKSVPSKRYVQPAGNVKQLAMLEPGARRHIVQKGETAGKISKIYGISLAGLQRMNNLDARSTVYVGQGLQLSVGIEKEQPEVVKVAAKARMVEPSPVVETPDRRLAMLEPEEMTVLSDAAVSVGAQLIAVPELQRDRTQDLLDTRPLGLRKAAGKSVAEAEPAPGSEPASNTLPGLDAMEAVVIGNLNVERVAGKKGKRYGVIRVEAGETLGHYAEWLEVPTQDIRRMNRLSFGSAIRTDQELKIPLMKVAKEVFEERRYEYHKELEEDFFAAYRVENVRIYHIQKGDNIWALCHKELDLPFWLLMKYNRSLDFGNLMPSQELRVPVVESAG